MSLTGVKSGRDRALDAALAVLRNSGASGVTMRGIADVAGMTAPALYWHYADKDALLRDLNREVAALCRDRIHDELGDGAPLDRLRNALETFRRFAVSEPHYYEALFVVAAPDGSARRSSGLLRILDELIRECIRHRLLVEDDPADLALTVAAHVQGLIQLYRRDRFESEERFADFFERSVDRLLKGIARE